MGCLQEAFALKCFSKPNNLFRLLNIPAADTKPIRMTHQFPALSEVQKRDLHETALRIVSPGKGILAADESVGRSPSLCRTPAPTVHNKVHGEDNHYCVVHVPLAGSMGKRLAQVGVDNTEENRRQFRQILFSADDRINSCLGGVIFFHETLYQHADSGVSFVKMIRDRGILIGVKVPCLMLCTSKCLHIITSWNVGIDSDTFGTSSGWQRCCAPGRNCWRDHHPGSGIVLAKRQNH